MKKLKAFTLAEVLITIGIIGIIAAMTLPTFYHKIQRRQAEVKLARFDSIMNQAIKLSMKDNGGIYYVPDGTNNGKYLKEWLGNYIVKYLKTATKIESSSNSLYYNVVFEDGSGFWAYINKAGNNALHFFYCLKASDKSCRPQSYDGKNTFVFSYYPDLNAIYPMGVGISDINRLKYENHSNKGCYIKNVETRHYCARLIMLNGWKIPDDYPWL